MKVVGLCVAFWIAGVFFQSFNCLSDGVSGMMIDDGSLMITRAPSRDLKGSSYDTSIAQSSDGDVSMEDYRPYDPSPSSKASVRPGPIVHGTPLMPHIPNPKPAPPPSFNNDDSP